jgi:hypothetical protein
MWIILQQGSSRQNHPGNTKTALHGSFLDESPLKFVVFTV